jgi:serine/threonine protein kinase
VGDFGDAKDVGEEKGGDVLRSMHGTPRYMAPEVVARQYTFSADIYSVGCTVLEMLTGEPPFGDYSTAESVIYNMSRRGAGPAVPSGYGADAREFLESCFQKAEARPGAQQLLLAKFVCAVRQPPVAPQAEALHSRGDATAELPPGSPGASAARGMPWRVRRSAYLRRRQISSHAPLSVSAGGPADTSLLATLSISVGARGRPNVIAHAAGGGLDSSRHAPRTATAPAEPLCARCAALCAHVVRLRTRTPWAPKILRALCA